MAENRPLGFGIVGCGVIGPTHARAIQQLPEDARLVAVCDVVPEKAQKFAAEYGGEAYTNLDEMLARPDIDVISVCVPSGLHAEVGVKAANAGKHLVVEKPIDITLDAADRLINASKQNNVKLEVISQHRFSPGMRQLREAVETGRFGKLLLGDAYIKWYRTQEYYDSGDWRGTWALDGGGCLMNQGVHYIDQLQWTMGPVESVIARTATAAHERIEVEDVATAILKYKNGAIGVIVGSTAVYPGLPERLEISGTGGTVTIEGSKVSRWLFKDELGETDSYGGKAKAATQQPQEQQGAGTAANPAALGMSGHVAQLSDMIGAIRENRSTAITGEDARRPLEVILAIYKSAEEGGKEVKLPLDTNYKPGKK